MKHQQRGAALHARHGNIVVSLKGHLKCYAHQSVIFVGPTLNGGMDKSDILHGGPMIACFTFVIDIGCAAQELGLWLL